MVAGFWPAQLVVAATLCETVDLRRLNGPLAQRLEQWTHNPLVPGSNPGGPTNFGRVNLFATQSVRPLIEQDDGVVSARGLTFFRCNTA